jgi:LysM repeat protein
MRTYTVQRGDTLGKIARQFGTTVRALQDLNQIPNADLIYTGQVLAIPDGNAGGGEAGGAGAAGRRYRVDSDIGVNVRGAPGTAAARLGGLPNGAVVVAQGGGPTPADGYTWIQVCAEQDGLCGWVAREFLIADDGVIHNGHGPWPNVLSVPQLYQLVRSHGAEPGLDRIMVAATLTESGGNSKAIGDGGHSAGLWQMHDRGLGAGMTIAERCDPDIACASMLPEFRRNYVALIRQDRAGEDLAEETYLRTERPASPEEAGPAFLRRWRAV